MAGRSRGRASSGRSGGHRYARSARLAPTIREIIAEELVRIDDERLELVTITDVDVDDELNRAHVTFDSLAGPDRDDEIAEILEEHRARLQATINRQLRAKKTPILSFRADQVIRSAERIDEILRADRAQRGERPEGEASEADTDGDR